MTSNLNESFHIYFYNVLNITSFLNLLRNASSSSSAASSPEPQRRTRTQAEILQEHRDSQRASYTIEQSSVQNERHIGE